MFLALSSNHNQKLMAPFQIRNRGPKERLLDSGRKSLLFLGLTLGSILIPVLHFVLVPIFFVIFILSFFWNFKIKRTLIFEQTSACLACGKSMPIQIPCKEDSRLHCPHCLASYRLVTDAPL